MLFGSEDGGLPDLVSKLSFMVGNVTALLCKSRVYLECSVQFWPPHFQKDTAELKRSRTGS